MRKIANLPEEFVGKGEVKGFAFKRIHESDYAFVYQVIVDGRVHYEVFKKKAKTNSIRFCYPTSKAFGFWAWCPKSYEKAVEIFEMLNSNSKSKS